MIETIRYTPGDCALLIGPAELVLKRQETARVAGLRTALLCTDPGDAERIGVGMLALAGQLADISGWMGAFTARMASARGPVDLAPLSRHEDGHFDWVLDFTGAGRAVPPPGYYPLPADDYPALKQALLEIARRTREGHEKPRYFQFDDALCAHQRQGIAGCSACLTACAAGAIVGGKNSIRIEPHLCQGCGACALACPTGAVRFTLPDTASSLERLRALLAAKPSAGLWIVPEHGNQMAPADWQTFSVTAPASLGLEFWLAALAGGYRRIAVTPGSAPEASLSALVEQLAVARALLAGLGLQPAVDLVETSAQLDWVPALAEHPAADLPKTDAKRDLLDAALSALIAHADTSATEIPLPSGAPFGAVAVDSRCTLCAACIRVCPTEALAYPGALNQLAFTESRCVQCGLCANVCPEKAVRLHPRLLVSKSARIAAKVVAEATMFACTGCGKPFATQAMIERSRAMMADHPAFQGNSTGLMELCMDCRQKAMAGVPLNYS